MKNKSIPHIIWKHYIYFSKPLVMLYHQSYFQEIFFFFFFFFFLSKSFSIALFNSLHVLLYFSLTFCLTFQFSLSLRITPFVPLQPSHIFPFKKKKVFSLFHFFPFSFSLLVDFLKLHLLFFHL